jgi:alkylhydroperoxidase family enzyme
MAHQALVTRVLDVEGQASRAQRRAAFDNAMLPEPLHGLVSKVAQQPTQITDDDFTAVQTSGFSQEQIFELVVCAAIGQATRQYLTALEALAAAITDGRR